MQKLLTTLIYSLSGLIGIVAFLYPFFIPQIQTADSATARSSDAPILIVVLLLLCLGVLLVELQGQAISAKVVATLGVLVAVTSVLRFIEVAIPAPGGFSPIFAPIILAGFVFGARFGFLMGAMTLLVSGLITGGVGPWLPFQMFTAGWMGLIAGWLPHPQNGRFTLLMLLLYGLVWGVLYGAIINLYFWPFAAGTAEISWQYGHSFTQAIQRYAAFYILTSLVWDFARSAGNVILLLILGQPVIRALTRFRHRFHFAYE